MNPKQLVKGFLAPLVLAYSLSLPGITQAQLLPTSATGYGPDDFNSSTLNPNPLIAVYSCPWIDTGLANSGFTPANGWTFSYAGAGASGFVQQDISLSNYFAWVVTQPPVRAPDGVLYPSAQTNRDQGGAVFGLTYTPQAGDPTNVHFIQAYRETIDGVGPSVFLDAGGATATNPTNNSPFYDARGAAGTFTSGSGLLNGRSSWFLDIPFDAERESNESRTNTDVQFQVFVCVESQVGTNHNVTLYGGDWWGYNYFNYDAVPEPSTFALLGTLSLGTAWWLRRRKKGGR